MNMAIAQTFVSQPAERCRASGCAPYDEDLLRLIADGDQSAMGALFGRHNVQVFRFVLGIIRDQALAEDVVSDVFLDVWRTAGSFKGRSQVSTWLLAIARHKALGSVQTHARDRSHEELSEAITDPAEGPELTTHRAQMGTVLAECLGELSTVQREIINLVYYHQRTVAEVAKILDIPPRTVKSRMFYARKHVTKLFAMKAGAGASLSV
jgi:RNA polymerase sigma-70 factor (ECF subfamily)